MKTDLQRRTDGQRNDQHKRSAANHKHWPGANQSAFDAKPLQPLNDFRPPVAIVTANFESRKAFFIDQLDRKSTR
ncbi:MAG: hypothetical protein VB858_12640, partial [Planctomycetaceae bacterium]